MPSFLFSQAAPVTVLVWQSQRILELLSCVTVGKGLERWGVIVRTHQGQGDWDAHDALKPGGSWDTTENHC